MPRSPLKLVRLASALVVATVEETGRLDAAEHRVLALARIVAGMSGDHARRGELWGRLNLCDREIRRSRRSLARIARDANRVIAALDQHRAAQRRTTHG